MNIDESKLSPELKALLIKEGHMKAESGWWVPKNGEEYFLLIHSGVTGLSWKGVDYNVASRQPLYRTREEAEVADRKRIALTTIQRYIAEHFPFTPDWSNDMQKKFYIGWDHEVKKPHVWDEDVISSQSNNIYVATKENAQALATACAEEFKILYTTRGEGESR